MESTTQHFIDALAAKGGPAIYTLSPADARNVLAGAQSGPIAKLPADIEAKTLPIGPTGKTKVYVVRPAGVTVTAVRYNGTIHDFVMLNAVADTPAAKAAVDQANAALRKAFAGK